MCELFAISSKVPTKTTFSLEEFARHGGKTAQHTDGWGLAFYDGSFAQIFHEAEPSAYSKWMQFLQGHQTPTRRLISHIRRASVGERALRNTQPFSRELGGKRHVFCHNGDLKDAHKKLELGRFRAIGDTDSEHAFCFLLSKLEPLWRDHPPSLDDRTSVLKKTFSSFSKMGPANFLYSDSDYLYAFANRRTQANGRMEPPGMYYLERHCDSNSNSSSTTLSSVAIENERKASNSEQKIVLFASVPLSEEKWQPFEDNQMIVSKDGCIL